MARQLSEIIKKQNCFQVCGYVSEPTKKNAKKKDSSKAEDVRNRLQDIVLDSDDDDEAPEEDVNCEVKLESSSLRNGLGDDSFFVWPDGKIPVDTTKIFQ